jgi:transcriptional regulator with XRE-family HTH domain
MGVAQPHVSAWLNGARVPNSQNLKKMAIALGKPMQTLAQELHEIQNYI